MRDIPDDRQFTLHLRSPEWGEENYVAIAIHRDYLDEPVIVGMTVIEGLKKLREFVEADGA